MPPFASRPVKPSSLVLSLRRHPFTLFGLPFLSLIVLSSFALSGFTQTRYDYRDQKVQSVSKEDELGMRKDRRKIDVREEYWRMRSSGDIGESDEYENVRVARLPGQAEWGELPIAKKDP
ncbi:hypothetical protein JCM8115_003390 [Rhodotorula mucilaginosa]|uniref:Cytochrome c oxidase assembly protein COX16, mitochondrial n=1 Tax=Rhodotorula mucilaginosa TaxID=5537 RepID=A0A9P7B2W1_RHOMI|nr:Cytochrome oxidase assembly [Rhodotorula mucilaginosa]TKA50638.1 hypothetical protein B0A53_06366 [Rhodotorula sp. CCFEE 5036]